MKQNVLDIIEIEISSDFEVVEVDHSLCTGCFFEEYDCTVFKEISCVDYKSSGKRVIYRLKAQKRVI